MVVFLANKSLQKLHLESMINVVGNIFNNARHNLEQDVYDKWFERAGETLTDFVLNAEESPLHKSQLILFSTLTSLKKDYLAILVFSFLQNSIQCLKSVTSKIRKAARLLTIFLRFLLMYSNKTDTSSCRN